MFHFTTRLQTRNRAQINTLRSQAVRSQSIGNRAPTWCQRDTRMSSCSCRGMIWDCPPSTLGNTDPRTLNRSLCCNPKLSLQGCPANHRTAPHSHPPTCTRHARPMLIRALYMGITRAKANTLALYRWIENKRKRDPTSTNLLAGTHTRVIDVYSSIVCGRRLERRLWLKSLRVATNACQSIRIEFARKTSSSRETHIVCRADKWPSAEGSLPSN
jgi:hypothetical protein